MFHKMASANNVLSVPFDDYDDSFLSELDDSHHMEETQNAKDIIEEGVKREKEMEEMIASLKSEKEELLRRITELENELAVERPQSDFIIAQESDATNINEAYEQMVFSAKNNGKKKQSCGGGRGGGRACDCSVM